LEKGKAGRVYGVLHPSPGGGGRIVTDKKTHLMKYKKRAPLLLGKLRKSPDLVGGPLGRSRGINYKLPGTTNPLKRRPTTEFLAISGTRGTKQECIQPLFGQKPEKGKKIAPGKGKNDHKLRNAEVPKKHTN